MQKLVRKPARGSRASVNVPAPVVPWELANWPPEPVPERFMAGIVSGFTAACKRYLGAQPSAKIDPLDVRILYRMSGGRLGNALAVMDEVVQEAASRGFFNLGLSVVHMRWGA